MAYTKQIWSNNDPERPVSAARLNHIEAGIETAQASAEYATPLTVSMLAEGAVADGVANDYPIFSAARTKAGAAGTVHFPAKRGADATTYFLAGSRPSMSGTNITADASVTLKFTDASPGIKDWGLRSPVAVENVTHNRTRTKPPRVAMQVAPAMAAAVRPQPLNVTPIDATTWTAFNISTAAFAPAIPAASTATVTATEVTWASAFAVGWQGVRTDAPALNVMYEAGIESATLGAGALSGVVLRAADEHVLIFYGPNAEGNLGVTGSADFGALAVGGIATDVYHTARVPGGAVFGVILRSLREVEFYINSRMIRRMTLLKDVVSVGFGSNYLVSSARTIRHIVSYSAGYTPERPKQITVSCVGDSITYGAWQAYGWPELLPIAFSSLPDGGQVTVRQNVAISGTTAAQWATTIGTYDFTGDDYVLVLLGANDIQAVRTLAQFLADCQTIATAIVAEGSKPIFGITPTFITPVLGDGTGLTTAASSSGSRMRSGLVYWAATMGYQTAMIHHAWDNQWKWYDDNIHPGDEGQAIVARAFAQAIARAQVPALT